MHTRAIALLLALAPLACAARVSPRGPGDTPSELPAGPAIRTPAFQASREVVIGELCPGKAAGRPAVSMLFARRALSWSRDSSELNLLVTRGAVQRFTVLSFSGKRAGIFTAMGTTELSPASQAAVGGYAGDLPCAEEVTAAQCMALSDGCGLALAQVRPLDPEETLTPSTGAGCVQEGKLLVDTDQDGRAEAFPLDAFLDEMRAPSEEVLGESAPAAGCQARFATPSILGGTDPRFFKGMDLVGVLDVDGDGRNELVIQFRYADKRTWALYTAQVPLRLSLVGESEPWAS
ncbi:MAG: hypothetical protein HY698_20820 [Deltaproteobacteria bacterium]|nr:hypothetical protein [Deltaproteobacteria bacterium]